MMTQSQVSESSLRLPGRSIELLAPTVEQAQADKVDNGTAEPEEKDIYSHGCVYRVMSLVL